MKKERFLVSWRSKVPYHSQTTVNFDKDPANPRCLWIWENRSKSKKSTETQFVALIEAEGPDTEDLKSLILKKISRFFPKSKDCSFESVEPDYYPDPGRRSRFPPYDKIYANGEVLPAPTRQYVPAHLVIPQSKIGTSFDRKTLEEWNTPTLRDFSFKDRKDLQWVVLDYCFKTLDEANTYLREQIALKKKREEMELARRKEEIPLEKKREEEELARLKEEIALKKKRKEERARRKKG